MGAKIVTNALARADSADAAMSGLSEPGAPLCSVAVSICPGGRQEGGVHILKCGCGL